MNLNWNDGFEVTLTPLGVALWTEYHTRLGLPTPKLRRNVLRQPLHSLALIFGHTLWMGNTELPFTNTNLRKP